MATKQEKQNAVNRYQQDTRIPIEIRAGFAAATAMDKILVPGNIAISAVCAAATAGLHFYSSLPVWETEKAISSAPPAIDDLGERMHKTLPSGSPTFEQDSLRQAALTLLSRQPGDIRNLKLVFSAAGNVVVLQDETTTLRRFVEPKPLADEFRKVLTERKEAIEEGRSLIDSVMLTLTAGLAFCAWKLKRISDQRMQTALDHYNIK